MKAIVKIFKASLLGLSVLLVSGLSSCTHKDLCYDHPHVKTVNVAFDWTEASSADPASMNVFFFSKHGGDVIYYQLVGKNGGTVNLAPGQYQAICFNGDTENLQYILNPESFEKFYLTTHETSILGSLRGAITTKVPRAADTDEQKPILQPDMLYRDAMVDLVVTDAESQTITFVPRRAVRHFTVIINDVENIQYVSGYTATISGFDEGYWPGPGISSGGPCIIPFDLSQTGSTSLAGGFNAFGHCGDFDAKHYVTIYVVLGDGTGVYYTYDVTDQVHSAADQWDVTVVVDDVPIPKPITNGSGLKPSVDEWYGVEIDVVMPTVID
ncbi:MAG: DUF5119 domain-containing protein [Bacteroidales bacterium]|nr:DUF5119 domain-containing protein [Bacteroidales bacterium]